jgi:hypothetical protein
MPLGKSGGAELSIPTYINIKMPDKVGVYSFSIEFAIDSQTIKTVQSPLFVTKATPSKFFDALLRKKMPPRLSWYEKSTSWAAGEQENDIILSKLQTGVYNFGRDKKWRYGYCFGGYVWNIIIGGAGPFCRNAPSESDMTCFWDDLIDEHSACNYGDCHAFGRTLRNLSKVLGIDVLDEVMPKGSENEGFITIKGLSSSSLDPVFSGNVRLRGDSTYNRYYFADHNLQKYGSKFYDVTFNQTYSSETAFIDYNIIKKISSSAPKKPNEPTHYTTVEGATMYIVEEPEGVGYSGWGKFEYTPPSSTRTSQRKTRNAATVNATPIRLIGSPKFQRVDTNNDGLAEILAVEVVMEILVAGKYLFNGTLQKDGRHVTDMPYYNATMPINAVLNESPGIYPIQLGFSGENIFRSGEDGPYELVLNVVIGNRLAMTQTFPTPPYKHTQFAELAGIIKESTDAAVDEDGNGKFDFIETTVSVEIRTPGKYSLRVDMGSKNSIVHAGDTFILTQGTHQLKLHSPSREVRRSGIDGPYRGIVYLKAYDHNRMHDEDDFVFFTQAYRAADFEVLLELDGTFKDQGIDTNDNGLFERLQIEIGVDITEAGTFWVSGCLMNMPTETTQYKYTMFTNNVITLSAGPQTLTFNTEGKKIHRLKADGPYEFEVTIRDPNTFEELDSVKLEQITAAYKFTDFEPDASEVIRPISLNGNSVDKGVDTNGNGLFDELRMEVEVELTTSDFYEWSARLVDANETRIDFNSRQAWLNAGTATIDFVFDGNLIAKNGVNGPYSVMGLLMAGQTGPNLVSLDVAKTQAYQASQFEGFPDLSVELDSFTAVADIENFYLTWILKKTMPVFVYGVLSRTTKMNMPLPRLKKNGAFLKTVAQKADW